MRQTSGTRLSSTAASLFLLQLLLASRRAACEELAEPQHAAAHGLEGLSTEVCQRIPKLQVCSERASAVELALEESTLSSFRALWEAGFMCYDMEFVATKDLQLVAANPERLRWAVEELEPSDLARPSTDYTVRQLRELGASIYQLPTLDQFLRDLHRRMVAANLHNITFEDSDTRRPWMFVRLMEPAYSPALLKQVAATVGRHRAAPFLVLAFGSREEAEGVLATGLWGGKTMRMFGAEATLEGVRAEDLSRHTVLGAHAAAPDDVLGALAAGGRLAFAAGVETEPELLRALRLGIAGVSTPRPVRVQQALHAWLAECRAKEVNPATLPDSQ